MGLLLTLMSYTILESSDSEEKPCKLMISLEIDGVVSNMMKDTGLSHCSFTFSISTANCRTYVLLHR